jgi:hypothetical protein
VDEEDIDIVGDDGNNNKNNTSGNSSESSRDLQLHVYGPPQFTEADVLASICEHEEALKQSDEEGIVKREVTSPDLSTSNNIDEHGIAADSDQQLLDNEDVKMEDLKEKLKQFEDKSKCSKCLVSTLPKYLQYH